MKIRQMVTGWHGWENRGDAPCRLAVVLIGGAAPTKHLHYDR